MKAEMKRHSLSLCQCLCHHNACYKLRKAKEWRTAETLERNWLLTLPETLGSLSHNVTSSSEWMKTTLRCFSSDSVFLVSNAIFKPARENAVSTNETNYHGGGVGARHREFFLINYTR